MALLLTGCASSEPSGEAVKGVLQNPLLQPPAQFTAECDPPAEIPPGPMSAGAAERLVAHDRSALFDCRDRQAALSGFVRDLLARLGGLQ